MNKKQWNAFCLYKEKLKKICEEVKRNEKELRPLQKGACKEDTPEYSLENTVVYNTSYDDFTETDEIKLIVVGDNPGKEEQLEKNRKYLVGQSGRIADGFFKRNSEFQIDFRKNVIISNKTPIHSAKTKHLKYIKNNGSENIKKLLEESQIQMAEITAELHKSLIECADENSFKTQLWIIGYAELKEKGIFEKYRNEIKSKYSEEKEIYWDNVFVFQHFSMNRFLSDLNLFMKENKNCSVKEALYKLGHLHRDKIFEF